jgi:hypothetical protein
MSNFIKSYQANVGLNHVPAYQVSGQPFATGSIDASTAVKVEFPYVTRWGSESTQFTQRLELKVSEIWLSGSAVVDVVAGLTSIPTSRVVTDSGPSWSGSAGVG